MTKTTQILIPQELIEARGNYVLLLGKGRMNDLAQTLARECDYPPDKADRSLPAVARYYQAMRDARIARIDLIGKLRQWLEDDGDEPTSLHRAIADSTHVERIVDFSYDDKMKTALREAGRAISRVICDHELPYADHNKVLLVKPYGGAEKIDSLTLTEEDYDLFVRKHPLLTDKLRLWAATQVLLWVGVDPTDYYWQQLHRDMTEVIAPRHRREYALVQSREEEAAWKEFDITALLAPDPVAWLSELNRAVAALPPLPADVLPAIAPQLNRRPYKFLDFYTAADADLFFGREEWTERLAARILAQPLTILFGRSGVGKTSLLRAGVGPRLEARDCWVIYARPGEDPLAAIRDAVEAGLRTTDRQALTNITELDSFIVAAAERVDQTPVIILDQAEECFTALSPAAQQHWVTALARALQRGGSTTRWVLSLREDFAAELHEWTPRVPSLFDHTERLTPLDRAAARAAIAKPPRQVGVVIEDELVERLLDDLTIAGVAPPQLQIVCERLYRERDETRGMTLAAYEALGTASRILAEYVDFALAQFPHAQRELAVALLKALVTGRETKLPLRTEEILDRVEGGAAEKQAVLNELEDARLVRRLEQGAKYELAHDLLVEKVRSWIDETEQEAKTARDLLRQGKNDWTGGRGLPEPEKVAYIYAQRENPYLHLNVHDLELLLRAALAQGQAPEYWARRAAEAGLDLWPVLAPALEAPQEEPRIHALWALSGWAVPRALEALRAGMTDSAPRVRVVAHQALYRVGSPAALTILDASDDLRLVPAGAFTMGSEQYHAEKPVHQVTLEAFFIEKYPVTNARYARFIEAGGYETERYWTRGGWRWARRVGRTQPAFWTDEKLNQPEYPVVGVTWYEAWAYAQWAGRRLPTEAEWEKAARGTAGREYPWGTGFDSDNCNTSEAKLRRTTPVGKYSPRGDSPYGAADMAGNVWEWTSSLYQPYRYQANDGRENSETPGRRVLRGGAWNRNQNCARCASRSLSTPDCTLNAYGVRCAVVARRSLS